MLKISSSKLKKIILEEMSKLGIKNEPKDIKSSFSSIKDLEDSLVDMLQNSYQFMGGWKGLETPEALKKRFTNFYLIDVDEDPEPDAGIYYTDWGGSKKASAIVSDESQDGKAAVRKLMKDFFGNPGSWIEVSGAPANIAIKKLGLEYVSSEKEIRALLKNLPQDDIEFRGKHPDPSVDYGDGWYTRTIGDKRVTKIIVGSPP
jgi:hypothetical protein